jgi:hypothetical protein
MNEIQIAKQALKEIERLYLRSNKRGQNTCEAMYRRARAALEMMEQSTHQKAPCPSSLDTMADIKQFIKTLDPGLPEDDDAFKTATLLLAALIVGADEEKLADFTGLDPDFIAPRAERLRQNGVWQGEQTHCDWDNEEGGAIAFWLDVNVAEGYMGRKG